MVTLPVSWGCSTMRRLISQPSPSTSSRGTSAFLRSPTRYASFDSCIVFSKISPNSARHYTHTPRRLGLNPMHLLKELLQPHLQIMILRTLVELAQEVAARAQRVVAERQCCVAQILTNVNTIPEACWRLWKHSPYCRHGLETAYRSCSSSCSKGY